MVPGIEAPNNDQIQAFEQMLNILEGIVERGFEINTNLNLIEPFITVSEQLCVVIKNKIRNGNIQDGDIPVYSNFINRCITMYQQIMTSSSNLTDEQNNRFFRDPIENLRSTLILLESHQNQGERIRQQGGKKITRNKKSRKGKKSRRKNRKSRRKYRKI